MSCSILRVYVSAILIVHACCACVSIFSPRPSTPARSVLQLWRCFWHSFLLLFKFAIAFFASGFNPNAEENRRRFVVAQTGDFLRPVMGLGGGDLKFYRAKHSCVCGNAVVWWLLFALAHNRFRITNLTSAKKSADLAKFLCLQCHIVYMCDGALSAGRRPRSELGRTGHFFTNPET
jgi:hypothetical protein